MAARGPGWVLPPPLKPLQPLVKPCVTIVLTIVLLGVLYVALRLARPPAPPFNHPPTRFHTHALVHGRYYFLYTIYLILSFCLRHWKMVLLVGIPFEIAWVLGLLWRRGELGKLRAVLGGDFKQLKDITVFQGRERRRRGQPPPAAAAGAAAAGPAATAAAQKGDAAGTRAAGRPE